MASAIDMDLVQDEAGASGALTCRLRVNDPDLLGHAAVFSIVAEVEVKRSSGVDHAETLYSHSFQALEQDTELTIPKGRLSFYSYAGKHIDLQVHTRVEVDDAMIFDTTVSEEQLVRVGLKPRRNSNVREIIEPSDTFQFFSNLKAIPRQNQLITLALVVLGGLVMLANAVIGVHDQLSPESATWLYSHYDSDGDANSPLVTALVGSGALGAGVWFAMRHQLRKYMQFRLRKLPDRIRRGVEYAVESLFAGRSRVPLEDVTLRVVACNMECGQYRERRGSQTVTVSFREPVSGVVLYEKRIGRIPANTPIADYFAGPVSFDPMFSALYPPAMLGRSHGVDVRWEVQLLHPEFVDQELVGLTAAMAYEDFLSP